MMRLNQSTRIWEYISPETETRELTLFEDMPIGTLFFSRSLAWLCEKQNTSTATCLATTPQDRCSFEFYTRAGYPVGSVR